MMLREPMTEQLNYKSNSWDKKIKKLWEHKIKPYFSENWKLEIVKLNYKMNISEKILKVWDTLMMLS